MVNIGSTSVNSLPKTVTPQRRGCDLNPGPSVPESSTLTTRLPNRATQHIGVGIPKNQLMANNSTVIAVDSIVQGSHEV